MTAIGLTVLVPNAVAVAGLIALVAALEVRVRVVEEPYLAAVHGRGYLYAGATGRFVPRLGRLRARGWA